MADYTLSAKITGDDSGFQKAIQNAQKAAQNFDKAMSGVSSKLKSIGSGLQEAGKKASALSVAFGGALGVGIKYNATVEQLETSFAVMTGSAEEAADIVAKLQKIGASTPFEFTDLANTTNMLMQFGFTAEESISSMQMLGDISQGSAEKMDSIARAYGKMHSSGKVTLEDINMMIDAGFNPLQQMSQQTGESMSSLYDRISSGTMSVEEITAAMQNATSEGGMYFQSMQQQSQTFSGQMSTLGDNVKTFLGNISSGIFEKLSNEVLPKINEVVSNLNTAFETGGFQGIVDSFKGMSSTMDTIITKIEGFSSTLQNLGINPAIFAGVIAAAGPFLVVLGSVIKMVSGVVGTIGKIGSVVSLLANPIGIAVAAIAGLIAIFAYLYNTNDEFKSVVTNAWNTISSVISSISNSLGPIIQQAFGVITTIIDTLGQAFSGFFSGLTQGLGNNNSSIIGFALGAEGAFGGLLSPIQMLSGMFQQLMEQVQPLINMITSNLVPIFTLLGQTIGEIASALFPAIQSAIANLIPTIGQIASTVMTIIGTVLPVLIDLITQLMPFISQIAGMIGQLFAALAPVISQLINSLLPVITNIITVIMNVIQSIMPALIAILNVVMSVIGAIIPVITNIVSIVVSVISAIISAISPIISFIGMIISTIMAVITPIITFIANIIAVIIDVIGTIIGVISGILSTIVSIITNIISGISNFISGIINTISGVISSITNVVSSVFNKIYSVVKSVMTKVGDIFSGIFNGIKSAWNGLTGFVSGVIDGIRGAFDSVVNIIKGVINGVIDGINGAIWVINLIPGVEIDPIDHLLHGTDNWQGGFAYMNEGGRGELTYLPNGSQVIPHDLSVRYMKESAKANSQATPLDVYALGDYIVEAVTAQGEQIANGVQNGISKMRMVANNREQARFIADLGFVRG